MRMKMEDLLQCHNCGKPLNRIKKAYLEYELLDNNVFRLLNCMEGIAGEVKLYCGHCGCELNKDERAFYYERWFKTQLVRKK